MIEKLLKFLENKRILILGMGVEGKSTYNFLRRNFPEKQLFIADRNTGLLNNIELMEDMNLEISLGEEYLNGIDEYDLIIKTPGISFKGIDISSFQNKITNQLQLLLEFVDVFTIGVTGTKGKSTTSSLIYQVLKAQEKNVFLLGNIGDPIFDSIEKLEKESIAVLELSSHELQYIKNSPNIAIWLNVYKEHLDFYETFEKYCDAKFNITKYQKDSDLLIYNYDNETMKKYSFRENDYAVSMVAEPNTKNKVFVQGEKVFCNNKFIMSTNMKINLKGMYNINNILFVLSVCDILKLDFEKALETIAEFKTLEHRLEFVGKYNGIEFYNNSIATIPEATIQAILALVNVNTVIVGGKDRGISQEELIEFLADSEVKNIICLPKTGEYIFDKMKNKNGKKLYYFEDLKNAVKIAKEITEPNTICLLSPAASSYGYFKNFEERGKLFKKYVSE